MNIIFAILSSPGWNAGEGLLRSIDFVISTVQEYSLFQLSPTFLLVLFILSNLHLILSFPLTPFLSVGPLSCDRCRMVSLLGGLKTSQEPMWVYWCVCDIKCVTPLVCQRELASIFLNVLCIAVSDLSALTADRLDTFRTKKKRVESERKGAEEMQWAEYHSKSNYGLEVRSNETLQSTDFYILQAYRLFLFSLKFFFVRYR